MAPIQEQDTNKKNLISLDLFWDEDKFGEKYVVEGGRLTVRDVDLDSNDTATYQCAAHNTHGTLFANFYLNVQGTAVLETTVNWFCTGLLAATNDFSPVYPNTGDSTKHTAGFFRDSIQVPPVRCVRNPV